MTQLFQKGWKITCHINGKTLSLMEPRSAISSKAFTSRPGDGFPTEPFFGQNRFASNLKALFGLSTWIALMACSNVGGSRQRRLENKLDLCPNGIVCTTPYRE